MKKIDLRKLESGDIITATTKTGNEYFIFLIDPATLTVLVQTKLLLRGDKNSLAKKQARMNKPILALRGPIRYTFPPSQEMEPDEQKVVISNPITSLTIVGDRPGRWQKFLDWIGITRGKKH